MSLVLLLGIIIIFQDHYTSACPRRRTKELTDSYVPVGIQALNHYKSQLQIYYPYALTKLCGTGKQRMGTHQSDFCVVESLARINLLLADLEREATKQNLEHSQGLSRVVLADLKKISQMTTVQQFHFILEKLQKEIGIRTVACKISEFLQDLENPKSKLFRNLAHVKPISYLI